MGGNSLRAASDLPMGAPSRTRRAASSTARRIGVDCQIAQQVTVGYDDRGGSPALGDRVRVGAGAIILGPIEIGDDAVIGAGAVVIRDVPAGKVVGGVPAQVIEGAADRFSALRGGADGG